MSDVFTSLAEQALGHSTAIQPLVASRFGIAPDLSVGMATPMADDSESTTSLPFTPLPPRQTSELSDPLIPPDEARMARPLPSLLQMAQAVPAIQAAPESDAIALEDRTDQLGVPPQTEMSVGAPIDSAIDLSGQIVQRQHLLAMSAERLNGEQSESPLIVGIQQPGTPFTEVTSDDPGPVNKPSLSVAPHQSPPHFADSSSGNEPSSTVSSQLPTSLAIVPTFQATPEAQGETATLPTAQAHPWHHTPVVSGTEIEPIDTTTSTQARSHTSHTIEAASNVVERQVTSTDIASVDQPASRLQRANSPRPRTARQLQPQTAEQFVTPMTAHESVSLVSQQTTFRNHPETPNVSRSLPVTVTHQSTPQPTTRLTNQPNNDLQRLDLAPPLSGQVKQQQQDQHSEQAIAPITAQPNNGLQPLDLTPPLSGQVTRQQRDQHSEQVIAPVRAPQSSSIGSQQKVLQRRAETLATTVSFATGEAETPMTLSPVTETPQPASGSTARSLAHYRNDSQPLDASQPLPNPVKHRQQDQKPEQVIMPMTARELGIEGIQKAALQHQGEAGPQAVITPINEAPFITLPLISAPQLSGLTDGTTTPYLSEQSRVKPIAVEGSITPRPDLGQLPMNALRQETAPRHQQHEAVTAPPTVRVTIGRIEVRTTATAQLPASRTRPAPPTLSLQDYLKQSRSRKP